MASIHHHSQWVKIINFVSFYVILGDLYTLLSIEMMDLLKRSAELFCFSRQWLFFDFLSCNFWRLKWQRRRCWKCHQKGVTMTDQTFKYSHRQRLFDPWQCFSKQAFSIEFLALIMLSSWFLNRSCDIRADYEDYLWHFSWSFGISQSSSKPHMEL